MEIGELEKIAGYAVEIVMLGASSYCMYRIFSYKPDKKENSDYEKRGKKNGD